MRFLSPAKINLVLKITGKDTRDGYHYIESIFDPVSVYDKLDIKISDTPGIRIKDYYKTLKIPQEKNIIFKAVKIIIDGYRIKKGVDIVLYKHIPNGAGLGGGSSNAATAIKAMNSLLKLRMSQSKMTKIAYKVGSDVPFFISCRPSFVKGKGDKISYFKRGKVKWYVIVVDKKIRVATKDAYGWFDTEKNLTKDISYTNIMYGYRKGGFHFLYNDFEKPVYRRYPRLRRLKDDFLQHRCLDASLSGSGSAVFAVFASRQGAYECFRKMRSAHKGSFVSLAHSI